MGFISDIHSDDEEKETKMCFNCGRKIKISGKHKQDYCDTCYREIILKK